MARSANLRSPKIKAHPHNTFLVPIDADAQLGNGSPGSAIGQTFDTVPITQPGTILVKYAYIGDLNLDGRVDSADFSIALANLGQATPGTSNFAAAWKMGDVTFDGTVNGLDFATMAGNFGAGSTDPLAPNTPAASPSAIPEPSSLAILSAVALVLFRHRCKSK